MLVGDIARYLESLAWLFQDDKTGSDELRRLGDMLRPHWNLTVVSDPTMTGGDAKLRSRLSVSVRNGKTTDDNKAGTPTPDAFDGGRI